MENDYMESLARAYNARLHHITGAAESPLLEEARDIVERQIACIDQMMSMYKQNTRALAYLKSLKQASERELISLGAGGKIPSYTLASQERGKNPFNTLVYLQIDLFITLDTLKGEGITLTNLMDCEMRALGFMSLLG